MISCTLCAYIVQRNKLKREVTCRKCAANGMSVRENVCCIAFVLFIAHFQNIFYALVHTAHKYILTHFFHLLSLSCFISNFFFFFFIIIIPFLRYVFVAIAFVVGSYAN